MVSSKKIDQKTGNHLFLSTIKLFTDNDKGLCEELIYDDVQKKRRTSYDLYCFSEWEENWVQNCWQVGRNRH